MEIKNIDNKRILVLTKQKFVELFSKGWPEHTYFRMNEYFTHKDWASELYTHFSYNQFYELCNHRGFVFEGRDRELVINTIKNGTPIDFDDYLLTDQIIFLFIFGRWNSSFQFLLPFFY
jgi:hypothetical protein